MKPRGRDAGDEGDDQLTIAPKMARTPHRVSQTRWGKASARRKKTVRRLRRSSSVTSIRTGSERVGSGPIAVSGSLDG